MAAEVISSGGHRPIISVKKQFPQRKTSIRHTSKPPSRLPEFEMIKPPSPMAPVVISVTEATPSSSDSSRKTSAESNSEDRKSKNRPHRPTITIPPKAYRAPDQQRTETPPIPLPPPYSATSPSATSSGRCPITKIIHYDT
ncbi:uncharacterized protein KY384_000610 [Bacidia gigantensis]|uniref:uncharacterized protein n=1 Tax=Bacidia gigantensis TaxID=2732470 RepID=UPI001D04F85C|nr:uncharacterized protein KY384_000610 [Bacidia gigantensis]KAG8525850.1 hypothetical protein KY384_000610 [Bacidia gigantensis]